MHFMRGLWARNYNFYFIGIGALHAVRTYSRDSVVVGGSADCSLVGITERCYQRAIDLGVSSARDGGAIKVVTRDLRGASAPRQSHAVV